jgi:methylmalonyl-CoA/ethylmalonyl-CoA epimerase
MIRTADSFTPPASLAGIGILGLAHIGLAVPSLADARRIYETAFGATFEGEEVVADSRVRITFLRLGFGPAAVRLELLEPTDEASPVAKYLAKRGAGLHHVAYEVEDIREALAAARVAGLQLIDEHPRPGAHGAEIAFLHPRSTGGLLTELCRSKSERNPASSS